MFLPIFCIKIKILAQPKRSCPSWVNRVTAKKAKLKLSAFLFLVLLIHCFSIPLCLLKACKGLFEVAFSGAAAIQMKPLGAGAHFPEEKRSKNFIWSFQLKVGAVGSVEAKQQLLLVDTFPLAATTNLPLAMKWMAASNSFSVSTFGGSLNSLDIFYFGGGILILFQLSGEILILTSFFLSFSMKSWLVRLFFKIAQGDFLVVPPHFLYQNPKTCSAKEELFYFENFVKN